MIERVGGNFDPWLPTRPRVTVQIGSAQAHQIIDRMEAQVRESWFGVARGAGVSERDCAAIKGAFAYPGFRLPLR